MIVATAGHVDHGKTSLVKALTRVDTDRLPEEKKRGLTIDLGFAYLPLASGPTIGFVDVPGHERFIHNMLCGVAGIDFVLLVVAADDGPMPQTREHLAILDLLGVSRGAVVLTKIDRIEAIQIAGVQAEITRLLAPTTLAGVPIFPVSTMTGEGLADLAAHLAAAAHGFPARDASGNFRLAIDRCFTIAGAGLVVTGTVMSGRVAAGDPVRVQLAGAGARVRSIHAQNAQAREGHAGQRCALNLAGIEGSKAQIARGDWVVAGAVPAPVRRIDARLRVLAEEKQPLRHWTPVHVHLGAAEVTGRIAVLEGPGVAPGESGRVQLVLERPIGALRGDRFIVRDQSAQRTLGGGRVIDVFAPPRGRAKPERLAYLAAMEQDDDQAALAALLNESPHGLDLDRFAANRNLSPESAARVFALQPMKSISTLAFSTSHWASLREKAVASLADWHRRFPGAVGPAEDRLLQGSGLRLPRAAHSAIAAELVRESVIVREGTGVRLPIHQARLDPADAALWRDLRPRLAQGELRPPTVHELAGAMSLDPAKLESALARIARLGLLVRLSRNRFFLPEMLQRLGEIAEAQARESGGPLTAAAFRDRSEIGRNLAIEVLEYFDRVKFTRRVGDGHVLLRAAREAFGRESHPGGAPGLQIR